MDLKKVYEKLSAPFPAEAYSEDKSRGFALTSLKSQYAVERLNETVGIAGWAMKGEFTETDKGILYLGNLNLLVDGNIIHSVEAIGYSDNKKNVGDTYKSARTDALSKASSYVGLGNEMFKGNVSTSGKASKSAPSKVETKKTAKPETPKSEKSSFRRTVKPETQDEDGI